MTKRKHFFATGTWLAGLLLLLNLSSCNNDKKEDEPSGASKPAVIATIRVNTPGGRVYYMGAYPDVPAQMDYRKMVELGGNVTVYSHGEHPYVWNGNSSTLTKYSVNDNMHITIADFVSFASTGLSGFFGPPAFISDTQAYFFVLGEGKVIEFNPSAMEITAILDVPPLEGSDNPDVNTTTYYNYVTPEGKVLIPVDANPGDFSKFPQYALVAVFDPATKSISYQKDTRMSMGYYNFAKDISTGDLYYRPSKNIVRAEDYSGLTTYPTTGGMLKVKSDGTYDQSFFVDVKKALNAHAVVTVVFVYGTKAVVQYIDASWTPPVDPGQWFSAPTKMALLDLVTLKHEPFNALSKYGVVYTVGVVDGKEYYANFSGTDGKYYFLRQTSPTDFEPVSESLGGSGIYIGRLR